MARKGRDLFEVLRERSGSSGGGRGGSGRSRKPAQSAAVGSELAKVGRDVAGWVKRRVGGEPPPEPEQPAHSGLILAGVAAGALLLGFVVGRVTSGSPAMAEELRRSGGAEVASSRTSSRAEGSRAEGVAPDWVRQGDAIAGDPAQEEQILSNLGYLLLTYPALERQQASDLAVWLRGQRLADARIRSLKDLTDGSGWVAVICYTRTAEQAETDLVTLRKLRAPGFAPELAEALSELTGTTKPVDVTFK